MSNYRTDLFKDLKNPRYSAKYLSAAYADSTEAFLVALRDVAGAQKGMTKLAAAAEVNRENLYRMLSKEGNPRFASLRAVFDALSLRVIIEPAADYSEPRLERITNQPRIATVNVIGPRHNPQSTAPSANPVDTFFVRSLVAGASSAGQQVPWGSSVRAPGLTPDPKFSGPVNTSNSEGGTAQYLLAVMNPSRVAAPGFNP